jgi:GntR family transcriptional regulator
MLRFGIRTGLYAGALPLEFELVKSLNTSRNALRAALQHLVTEGVVSRTRGAGTHVTAHRRASDTDGLRSYAESQPGSTSTFRVLEAREVAASPPVAAALELDPGTAVVLLERLALLDGESVAVMTAWLTASLVEGLLDLDLQGDYYELLEGDLGLRLGEAQITLDAVRADAGTAALLHTDEGAPLLYGESITTLADGHPLALVCSRSRPDRMMVTSTRWRSEPHREPALPV